MSPFPISSAKSERVFSTGGNFATKKRNRLAAKKLEELIVIKENKSKIEVFKQKKSYVLKRVKINPLENISVDEVLRSLVAEDDEELEDMDIFDSDDENERNQCSL